MAMEWNGTDYSLPYYFPCFCHFLADPMLFLLRVRTRLGRPPHELPAANDLRLKRDYEEDPRQVSRGLKT